MRDTESVTRIKQKNQSLAYDLVRQLHSENETKCSEDEFLRRARLVSFSHLLHSAIGDASQRSKRPRVEEHHVERDDDVFAQFHVKRQVRLALGSPREDIFVPCRRYAAEYAFF